MNKIRRQQISRNIFTDGHFTYLNMCEYRKKESNIFIVLFSVKIKKDFNNVDLLDVKVFSHR